MGHSLPIEIPFRKLPTAFSSLKPSQILSEFELGGNKFIPLQALTNSFRTESEVDESSERQVITEERKGASLQSSHQCRPGSIPGVHAICGLSLLLVLVPAPRIFSLGTPVFLPPQKTTFLLSNST